MRAEPMTESTAIELVLCFVERINAKDIAGAVALMSEDHRFIDSLGAQVVGRQEMRHAWEQYFRMVPDYRMEVHDTAAAGELVVLLGAARGTYTRDGTLRAENAWETPAAWRALVRGARVAEWQVYADNEPLRRIISAHSA